MTIECPGGHSNSATQKFCGECGLSLVGFCPNGHQNPEGQRYCGECGSPLHQSDTASPSPSPGAAEPRSVTPSHPAESGTVRSPGVNPSDQRESGDSRLGNLGQPHSPPATGLPPEISGNLDGAAATGTLKIGDELQLRDGIDAEIVKLDDETAWLNITKGLTSYGISTFPRRNVEKALADQRITISAPMSDPPPPDGSRDPALPAGPTDEVQAWWARLPMWGKVATVTVTGVFVLSLCLLPLAGKGHHEAPSGGQRDAPGSGQRDAPGSDQRDASGPARGSIGASTVDDWVASVCKAGTYSNHGGSLNNADASGFCMSPTNMPIMIGQYSSSFSAQSDAAIFPGASYAMLPQADGGICLFLALTSGSGEILRPLARFGANFGSS